MLFTHILGHIYLMPILNWQSDFNDPFKMVKCCYHRTTRHGMVCFSLAQNSTNSILYIPTWHFILDSLLNLKKSYHIPFIKRHIGNAFLKKGGEPVPVTIKTFISIGAYIYQNEASCSIMTSGVYFFHYSKDRFQNCKSRSMKFCSNLL